MNTLFTIAFGIPAYKFVVLMFFEGGENLLPLEQFIIGFCVSIFISIGFDMFGPKDVTECNKEK